MEDFISKFWQLIAAGLATLVWLVRLEAKVIANAKAQREADDRQKTQRAEDLQRAVRSEDRIYQAIQDLRKDVQEAIRK